MPVLIVSHTQALLFLVVQYFGTFMVKHLPVEDYIDQSLVKLPGCISLAYCQEPKNVLTCLFFLSAICNACLTPMSLRLTCRHSGAHIKGKAPYIVFSTLLLLS